MFLKNVIVFVVNLVGIYHSRILYILDLDKRNVKANVRDKDVRVPSGSKCNYNRQLALNNLISMCFSLNQKALLKCLVSFCFNLGRLNELGIFCNGISYITATSSPHVCFMASSHLCIEKIELNAV